MKVIFGMASAAYRPSAPAAVNPCGTDPKAIHRDTATRLMPRL
jgi:hypothetical protein